MTSFQNPLFTFQAISVVATSPTPTRIRVPNDHFHVLLLYFIPSIGIHGDEDGYTDATTDGDPSV
jgi:hypothetical protein